MPKPLAVDWDEAKALYIKGVPLSTIAERMAISKESIRQRAFRYKWKGTKTQTQQVLSEVVSADLQENAKTWVSKLDSYVHEVINELIKRGVSGVSPKDLKELVQSASTANQMARQNYGLDADQGGRSTIGLVHVVINTVPSSPVRLLDNTSPPTPATTIDVESVSVPSANEGANAGMLSDKGL
jgi:hypothetical protein